MTTKPDTTLHKQLDRAVADGDMGGVKTLVEEQCVGIDGYREDRGCPLTNAIWFGQLEIFKYLLGKGARLQPEEPGNSGLSPIFMALQCDEDVWLDLLLEHGADVNVITDDGGIPLLEAIGQGNIGHVTKLIEHGAEINNDQASRHPMVKAAYRDNSEILEFLINSGGKLDVLDKSNNRTPVFEAIANSCLESIKVLVRHDNNLNYIRNEFDDDLQPDTALNFALNRLEKYKKKAHKNEERRRQFETMQQIVNLLKENGAKTFEELSSSNQAED